MFCYFLSTWLQTWLWTLALGLCAHRGPRLDWTFGSSSSVSCLPTTCSFDPTLKPPWVWPFFSLGHSRFLQLSLCLVGLREPQGAGKSFHSLHRTFKHEALWEAAYRPCATLCLGLVLPGKGFKSPLRLDLPTSGASTIPWARGTVVDNGWPVFHNHPICKR